MSFFEKLKAATPVEWRAYTEHAFTEAMADGTLAESPFGTTSCRTISS